MAASILQPGSTCWRIERAGRVALLLDGQDYFAAVRMAILKAERSVMLLGWSFDPRTRLQPDGFERGDDPDEIGQTLLELAALRPEVDIRILIWKSALPIAASQEFFPHRARAWFAETPIHFRLDDATPLAGCHHQKVVVIDDTVAFCGGADFGVDRWDSLAHLDRDARRVDPDFSVHPPRHEVAMMVDGPAARALGDLARARWERAVGETLAPPQPRAGDDPWPASVRPALTDVPVAIVRTEPAWRQRPAVEEWMRLTLAAIGRAKGAIYMENQYFTSPVIAEALARRLSEPDGPEVVFISAEHSPSWFDRLTMDRTRTLVLRRLKAADIFGRFRAYCPETAHGHPIIIHAKLSVFDDQLLRVGSANLNNRSCALDTECEIAIEAGSEGEAAAIERMRDLMIGHFLGRSATDVAAAIKRRGGLIAAIEALNTHGRLKPIQPLRMGAFASVVAAYHLGDPFGVADAWNPRLRRRLLAAQVEAVARGEAPLG